MFDQRLNPTGSVLLPALPPGGTGAGAQERLTLTDSSPVQLQVLVCTMGSSPRGEVDDIMDV